MAKNVSIPVADHNTTGVCTAAYAIRIKPDTSTNWVVYPDQYDSPIVLVNLLDDVTYDYEIRRKGCDLGISEPATGTFTTTVSA